MKKEFIEVGRIVRTHGLDGCVKVEHWCDDALVFRQFTYLFLDNEGKTKKQISSLKFSGNSVILKFSDINSIDFADDLVGKVLFVDRVSFKLPANRFFIQDLIGMKVVDYSDVGLCYGSVKNVLNYGATDIYVVERSDNKEILIPVIDEIVLKKDFENGLIFIKPMEGLFDV